MKKRILALTLCAAALLTGCSSMLERDYVSLSPHPQLAVAVESADAIRVENYQQLVSALLALVNAHKEDGVIRLRSYTPTAGHTAAEDLTRARDEVWRQDPMGSYAVENLDISLEHAVMTYEATVTISYRRTQEDTDAIVEVMGSRAIRSQLRAAMLGFQPKLALRTNYFYDDADYIRTLVQETCYDAPAILCLPAAEVSLYPDSGHRRIIEVAFTYPQSRDRLARQSKDLLTRARDEVKTLRDRDLAGDDLAGALYELLRDRRAEEAAPAEALSTALCLTQGKGDSQGLALAYKLLCDEAGLDCQVVQGLLGGAPHFWTIVKGEQGYRHVDPSLEGALLLTDGEFQTSVGAEWFRGDYPTCGEEEENILRTS